MRLRFEFGVAQHPSQAHNRHRSLTGSPAIIRLKVCPQTSPILPPAASVIANASFQPEATAASFRRYFFDPRQREASGRVNFFRTPGVQFRKARAPAQADSISGRTRASPSSRILLRQYQRLRLRTHSQTHDAGRKPRQKIQLVDGDEIRSRSCGSLLQLLAGFRQFSHRRRRVSSPLVRMRFQLALARRSRVYFLAGGTPVSPQGSRVGSLEQAVPQTR